MRNETPLAPGGPASQMLARIVDPTENISTSNSNVRNVPSRTPATRKPNVWQFLRPRWRKLAELAQRQETEGAPIPTYFRDGSEAVHYAQAQGYVLYWKGTHAFARRQRELGDCFVARPVFTRKGATYVGLVPLDDQENASGKEPSNWRGVITAPSPNPDTAHRRDRSC